MLSVPARLAVFADAAVPAIFSGALALANRLLPDAPDLGGGGEAQPGWRIRPRANRITTFLGIRAATANNEIPAAEEEVRLLDRPRLPFVRWDIPITAR